MSHGKTTLTAAITKVLAASGKARAMNCEDLDRAPDERERGIGIHTRYTEYETDKRHYAHIDCPGHAKYMKNEIAGIAQMNAAILVVSAVDGIMPQTREHLIIAKHLGVSSLVVFINQLDRVTDDNELVELAELEIRLLLNEYEFSGSETAVVSGSALLAMEAVTENPQIRQGENKWVDKIFELIEKVDYYIPTPQREIDRPFLMAIDGTFSVTGSC